MIQSSGHRDGAYRQAEPGCKGASDGRLVERYLSQEMAISRPSGLGHGGFGVHTARMDVQPKLQFRSCGNQHGDSAG